MRVELFGDLVVGVIVEQFVDKLYDLRRNLDLLAGVFRVFRGERLGLAPFEADVDFADPRVRVLDERSILDHVGQEALSFAVRGGRIGPEPAKVRGHRQEPLPC